MTPNPRRALVTGASGAIGMAIARRLALRGLAVCLHAHRGSERLDSLAAELAAGGHAVRTVQFDLCDATMTRSVLEAELESGPFQVIVNNAGVHDDAVFPALSHAQWHRVIDVNLHGFFNVTQPLVLPMLRTRWGRIVSITSVAALTGNRGQVNYAAAKGAIHSATRALALELASRGVTVNAIAPGIIESEMSRGHFDAAAVARLVPMQRTGTPEEVAQLVDFLTGDSAAYITGQVISINGGMI